MSWGGRKPGVIDCDETGNICCLVLPTLFWFQKHLLTTNREETEENGAICSYLPFINSLVSLPRLSSLSPESPEEVKYGTEPRKAQTWQEKEEDGVFLLFQKLPGSADRRAKRVWEVGPKVDQVERTSFQLVSYIAKNYTFISLYVCVCLMCKQWYVTRLLQCEKNRINQATKSTKRMF